MDCNTPGFPVHHQLPELAQTHVCIDLVMPSHHPIPVVPLFSCLQSFPASSVLLGCGFLEALIVDLGLLLFSYSVVSDALQPHRLQPSGSSVHGISQARILEWVAISLSRGSSRPSDWTRVSCIGKQILYHWATREACESRDSGLTPHFPGEEISYRAEPDHPWSLLTCPPASANIPSHHPLTPTFPIISVHPRLG